MCPMIESVCGCHEGSSSNALDEIFASNVDLSDLESPTSYVPKGIGFDTKMLQRLRQL